MTTEEHNRFLGIAHLVHGGLQALWMVVMFVFVIFMMAFAAADTPRGGDAFPFVFFMMFMLVAVIMSVLFTIPSFVAGYGLLKRKQWAKTWGIIAGVLAAMSFPIGTAVCVYTFWFLLGDAGKDFYSKSQAEQPSRERDRLFLEPDSATYDAGAWNSQTKREYAQPPNWRD
jgi:hypothetical protein